MRGLQKRIRSTGPPAGMPPSSATPGRSAINAERLEEIKEALGARKLHALLSLLGRELVSRPVLIRRRLEQGDEMALRSEAHNFRGTVASFGLDGVAVAARAVETALPGAELHVAVGRLEDEVVEALASLRPFLRHSERRPRSR